MKVLLLATIGAVILSSASGTRSLQQFSIANAPAADLISAGLTAIQSDPNGTATALANLVNSTGSSSNLTDLMQQAVNAIGSYRMDLQNQLPAPVSSLTQLKGVNNLDTALTAQAATYVLQQLGSNNYATVVNGLTSLLANGSSANGNLSSLESYNTALSFVQALGRTQDSNGNTTAVASSFLSGLQNAAQSCINGLPSINRDSSSTVVTDQYNKCCPVIKATLDNANQLAGQSGLVNYLQQLQSQYSIVSKCSTSSSS
ncbi:g3380 [Coccomyxa viridis]|uniref:G3380 protein n=1 Tax=Coccomyxa viridis TaxID=1274662 RepID=A0ABP1FMN2_9CHLO